MATPTELPWLPIEVGYTEEFGPVDVDVYNAAGLIWPQAERLARAALHDACAGRRLMHQAVAAVSRVFHRDRGSISNLSAYISQAYKRLILAELKRLDPLNRAVPLLAELAAEFSTAEMEQIERRILVHQIVSRMDEWTRDVLDYLVLGYSFEEIGLQYGLNAHAVGNRYRSRVKDLRRRIEMKCGHPRRTASGGKR